MHFLHFYAFAKDLQKLLISHFAKVENSVKIAAVRKNEGGGDDCAVQGGGGALAYHDFFCHLLRGVAPTNRIRRGACLSHL